MKPLPQIFAVALAAILCFSPFSASAQQPGSGGQQALQQALGEALAEADATKLAEARALAAEAGMSTQEFLENQAIGVLYTGADALVDPTYEALEEQRGNWDFASAQMLSSERAFDGVMLALKARQALAGGDRAAFERHVKNAFWAEPQLAQILGQWINNQRQEEAMANLRFPLDMVVKNSAGEDVELAALVEGKKGLLLDFWASWCGPCMQLMPALKEKHAKLSKQGVVVAGMNTEGVDEAARVKEQRGMEMPWLVEPAERPLSQMLQIDSIPRMILVDSEGKVLFNGHPQDPALADALARVGADL